MAALTRFALLLVLPVVGIVTGAPPIPDITAHTFPVVTVTEDTP